MESSKVIRYTLYGVLIGIVIQLASCVFGPSTGNHQSNAQLRHQAGLVGMDKTITKQAKTSSKVRYRSRSSSRRR